MNTTAITQSRPRPLSDIIKERGTSQAHLSQVTGLALSTVHNASKPSGHPIHIETARLIADALKLQIEAIKWPSLVNDEHLPLQSRRSRCTEPITGSLCGTCFTIRSCTESCECDS